MRSTAFTASFKRHRVGQRAVGVAGMAAVVDAPAFDHQHEAFAGSATGCRSPSRPSRRARARRPCPSRRSYSYSMCDISNRPSRWSTLAGSIASNCSLFQTIGARCRRSGRARPWSGPCRPCACPSCPRPRGRPSSPAGSSARPPPIATSRPSPYVISTSWRAMSVQPGWIASGGMAASDSQSRLAMWA